MSELFVKAGRDLDLADALIDESKTAINAALSILRPRDSTACYLLPPKQGELFLYLPEENKAPADICLGALVETI
jgi:hypothetical protein